MTSRRGAALELQPSLFDDEAAPPAAPASPPKPPAPKAKSLRNHTLGLPRPWPKHIPCAMTCLTCRRPEGAGICEQGCAVVCGPPIPLDKKGKAPVEVCLLTTVLPARLISRHAAVSCPHCDHTHWHQPTPGRSYRVGQCGQPYTIHVPEVTAP